MTLSIAKGVNPDRVRDRLASCENFEDLRRAGILFHGTCEEIEGPLRGGAYDKVFWTAEAPSIAQAYIPRAGIKSWISKPDDYARKEHLPPTKHKSHAMGWALERAGVAIETLDITWDGMRAWSWRIPRDWPTLGDYDDHIRSLDYKPSSSGMYDVSERYHPDREYPEIMPADWRLPGQLIIVLADGLDLREAEWSEDAQGYANHNRVADFEDFGARGLHGIRMEDMLQSEYLGNVGHEAIGLLPAGLEQISWLAIPAVRHDGDDHAVYREPETAEFLAFMKELNPGYRSLAEIAAEDDLAPA